MKHYIDLALPKNFHPRFCVRTEKKRTETSIYFIYGGNHLILTCEPNWGFPFDWGISDTGFQWWLGKGRNAARELWDWSKIWLISTALYCISSMWIPPLPFACFRLSSSTAPNLRVMLGYDIIWMLLHFGFNVTRNSNCLWDVFVYAEIHGSTVL